MGNKYEKQFREHAVHDAIKKLEETLNKALASEKCAPHLDDLKKMHKAIIVIREKLSTVDPDLIAVDILNNLNTKINSTTTHVNSFLLNSQVQQITTALSNIDNALSFVPSLPISSNELNAVDITKERIDSFIGHVLNTLKSFDDTIKDLKNKATTAKSIAENSKSLSDDTKTQSNQLIAGLQKNNQDVISDLQKQWQTVTSDIQKQFSQNQTDRSDKFEKAISEHRENLNAKFKELVDSHNKKLDENFKLYNDKIDSILEDSTKRHAKIIGLYQIVASDSVGGAYKKTADDELITANRLRKHGLICLAGGAVWVLVCIMASLFNGISIFGYPINFTSFHAIPATTITFIVLSISAYLLYQSEKHRKTSLWANQVNLEVNAFEPFIDSMEDNDKTELRKILTGQLFGNINNQQNSDDKVETGLLIEKIFEIVDKQLEILKSKFLP